MRNTSSRRGQRLFKDKMHDVAACFLIDILGVCRHEFVEAGPRHQGIFQGLETGQHSTPRCFFGWFSPVTTWEITERVKKWSLSPSTVHKLQKLPSVTVTFLLQSSNSLALTLETIIEEVKRGCHFIFREIPEKKRAWSRTVNCAGETEASQWPMAAAILTANFKNHERSEKYSNTCTSSKMQGFNIETETL